MPQDRSPGPPRRRAHAARRCGGGEPGGRRGPAGELRPQIPAIATGLNTERLGTPGGPVASAGDIPVEVLAHSQECLAALPTCGA
ncbi:MAG TPA: hypothetical protein VKZ81_15955 [Pseudonocardia sp.]|nr:hypothetical protein [Pseudonocardia sp.]